MTFVSDLTEKVRKRGVMPLEEYMALCNQQYYNAYRPFGVEGDFITAPEISQMFGELIAAWSVDILKQLGSVDRFALLECGPGRGVLLNDILRVYKHYKMLENVSDILLLETSERLRADQKEKNPGHNLIWIKDIHKRTLSKKKGPFFIYANEFLDALPIEQYFFKKGVWWKRHVSVDNSGSFKMSHVKSPPPPGIPHKPKEGDVFERSPAVFDFTKELALLIKEKGGFALFIDYGYKKTAFGNTFQAVKSHEYVSPFENPGRHDLTAHVNFAQVMGVCQDAGLYTYGPVEQGTFLEKCGLLERAKALQSNASEKQREDIESAVHRLSSAEEMGGLFKVIAISDREIKPIGLI